MSEPGFWNDQERAQKISTEHARVARRLEMYERLRGDYDDAVGLLELEPGLETEIAAAAVPLRQELERLQEAALFDGEYDAGDAVVTLQSGTGGTDAQDWTEMVLRMYERWASDRGFRVELLEASPGEEAGLKSATFTIAGENAYGILKAERGKHRLVRLSPFDAAHRRQTSFATVIVAPLLPDDTNVEMIAALKPDVVLVAVSSRVSGRLKALGLKVVALEPRSYRDVKQYRRSRRWFG